MLNVCKQKPLLSAMLIASLGTAVTATPINAQTATPVNLASNYAIPAGNLDRVLNLFAAQSGILLAIDGSLTQNKYSKGLKGSYTIDSGLERILSDKGLQAKQQANGSYKLIRKDEIKTQRNTADTLPTQTLEPVIIVGSRAPQTLAEATASVYYIDEEVVQRGANQAQPLATIIANAAPSLDFASGSRTNFGQNLRGRPALIMIDGVSLNSSRSLTRQLDSINPFNIDHIEVLSGATALYGGNATGGIINIVTKKGEEGKLGGESFVSASSAFKEGDNFDYTLAQSLSGGSERVQGRVGIVYNKTGSFFDGAGERIIPDIIQGSLQHNETVDILTSLSFTPDESQQLDISAQYYNSEQDNPYGFNFGPKYIGLLEDPSKIQISRGFEADRQAATKRQQFNINYKKDNLFLGHHFIGQLSHRSEEMDFIPFIKAQYGLLSASQQNTQVTSFRAALVKELNKVTLTYGMDAFQERFDSNQMLFDPVLGATSGGLINREFTTIGRYPKINIDNISAFLQTDYQLNNKLSISGGYRFENLKNKVGDFIGVDQQAFIALGKGSTADVIPGSDNSYNVHLFNLGTQWDINNNNQTWLKFSQGFELPDPAKYYGRGNYTLNGTHWTLNQFSSAEKSNLAGIKTNSVELGWRYDKNALSFQTAAYYSISNKSIELADKTNLLIDVVDKKRRVYGIEGELDYDANSNLSLGGQFHLTRSNDKNKGKWERSLIVYASPSKLSLYADYHQPKWNLRLASNSLLSVKDEADNRINGYTTLNLSGHYKVSKAGQLSFGVSNLLDKDYTTVWGQNSKYIYGRFVPEAVTDYHGQGRTFTLSYRHKF